MTTTRREFLLGSTALVAVAAVGLPALADAVPKLSTADWTPRRLFLGDQVTVIKTVVGWDFGRVGGDETCGVVVGVMENPGEDGQYVVVQDLALVAGAA